MLQDSVAADMWHRPKIGLFSNQRLKNVAVQRLNTQTLTPLLQGPYRPCGVRRR